MSYECFELSVEGKVAQLKMSRPERRNAMTAAFWRELPQAVRELDASGKVRALVLCSTGPHFCAGLDLSMFQSSDALAVARRIAAKAPVAVAATKEMISYSRDHSVAESFAYLNALQPGIFSIEDIKRTAAARGGATEYADLPGRATGA